jgi:hypothetical protein
MITQDSLLTEGKVLRLYDRFGNHRLSITCCNCSMGFDICLPNGTVLACEPDLDEGDSISITLLQHLKDAVCSVDDPKEMNPNEKRNV